VADPLDEAKTCWAEEKKLALKMLSECPRLRVNRGDYLCDLGVEMFRTYTRSRG
jgi:hypothetical protein